MPLSQAAAHYRVCTCSNWLLTNTGHIGKELEIMHADLLAVQLNSVSQNFCSDFLYLHDRNPSYREKDI
jgi:hypothetical protein